MTTGTAAMSREGFSRINNQEIPSEQTRLAMSNTPTANTGPHALLYPCLRKGVSRLLPRSVAVLARHYLQVKEGCVYCREENFEGWQDLLTQMSPLPLLAACVLQEQANLTEMSRHVRSEEVLQSILRWGALPHCAIWDSWAAEYTHLTGKSLLLDDFHAHFSGMMQVDTAWQRALADSYCLCKKLEGQFRDGMPQNYLREGIGDVRILARRLNLARWLQETLALLVADTALLPADLREERQRRQRLSWNKWGQLCELDENCDTGFDAYFAHREKYTMLGTPFFSYGEGSAHPLAQCEHWSLSWPGAKDVAEGYLVWEGLLWLRALQTQSPLVACMLHCYGLLVAQFVRLSVQQPDVSGFVAFHAAAHSGLSRTHHLYSQQFMQLHSMDGKSSGGLDCRFSPPKSYEKFRDEYKKYKGAVLGEEPVFECAPDKQPIRPSPCRQYWLRPHFLKVQDKDDLNPSIHPLPNPNQYLNCRHAKLRAGVEKIAKVLVGYYDKEEKGKKLLGVEEFVDKELPIYGKDAAGNEMSCPPEVFAPAFRLLASSDSDSGSALLSNATYHVGEVFADVASGVRAVDEALRFLNLQCNDRIGHGTALGIDPAWWREKFPRVNLCKGALLDNLVWIWGIGDLFDAESHSSSSREAMLALFGPAHEKKVFWPLGGRDCLHEKICHLYDEIYAPINGLVKKIEVPSVLYRAWALRSLDVRRIDERSSNYMHPWEQKEISDINRARMDEEAFSVFEAYHRNALVRYNYNTPVEDDMGYIPDDVLHMLQDYVILKLNNAEIAVEVMPTSNKRITGYRSYAEHHAIRWLCDDEETNLPVPSIVLATDNPGLFSTTIRNEYVHLMLALNQSNQMTKSRCLDTLCAIHNKGEQLCAHISSRSS